MPEKDRSYHCPCYKWKKNIDYINSSFLLPLSALGEYKGEVFEYCPWCGKELVEYEEKPFDNQHFTPCVCGTPSFHQCTAGCPVHGTIEFGMYE